MPEVRPLYYILDEYGRPIPSDLTIWSYWMNNGSRFVRHTELPGQIIVSTVYLGIDHDFSCKGQPVLWETLIMGGPADQWMDRYTSQEAALIGHENAVEVALEAVESSLLDCSKD